MIRMPGLDQSPNTPPINEAPLSDASSVSTSFSLQQPLQNPLNDIIASKRHPNYLFKVDATRHALEKLENDTAEQLVVLMQLQDDILIAESELSILIGQYYAVEAEYQNDLVSFFHQLGLYGIDDFQSLFDKEGQEQDLYKKLLNKLSKKDKKFTQTEKDNIINQFINSYYDLQFKKKFSANRKTAMETFKKDIDTLKQKYRDQQKQIDDIAKQYYDIDSQGLLLGYEFSGEKPTRSDLIAPSDIEQQVDRFIALCTHKKQLEAYHLYSPKGALLVGGQDVGKTFLAKILASEINRKMYYIKAHDLFSEESTDPNDMITDFFFTVIDHVQKNNESCIIFLDEIEKIINSVGEYNPAQQNIITNTLIKNIINIQKSDLDIMIVAAVSDTKHIDPRLLKYDIFDNQFFLNLPQAAERKRFFEYYIQKVQENRENPMFSIASFDHIVQKTDGFSAEYIKQIISSCVKEYAYQEFQSSTPSPIDENMLIKKIDELKGEDKVKGKPRYFAR